jgi:hypothetical protein
VGAPSVLKSYSGKPSLFAHPPKANKRNGISDIKVGID